jgi:transposase
MIHHARRWVNRFDLSDEDWVLLEPLLPKSRKSARVDDRKIMNAIYYVLRTRDALAGFTSTLRPLYDGVQSLQPLVSPRRLGARLRPAGIDIAR